MVEPVLLDPNDGVALRAYYEPLLATMVSDRSSWDARWEQLAAFFAPQTSRFNSGDANRGERKDFNIINETGLLAKRTLEAGMSNGMSPQTKPWFKMRAAEDELNAVPAIKLYCEQVEEKVRAVFLKSNTYQSLLTLYGEEGLFGVGAFLVLEDAKDVIRCHPFPIGSFYLGVDDTLRVDLCIRVVTMTVRQIVERFGKENCSDDVVLQYNASGGGIKETRREVVQVIHKGSYFGAGKGGIKPVMPWVSIWYEKGSFNAKTGILRRSGFMESPLICGRWKVVGENVYGESPGMDCLGSVMSLQAWEERTAQACEKQINPPMLANADMDPRSLTTLPGDINFTDAKDVSNAFKPAYQFEFRLDGALAQIQRIESRINDAMYRSLFQTFIDSDRRQVTAEEIRAKQQEKMQVLGPVVEGNVGDVLGPLVMRTVSIMERKGLLPPQPLEMKGRRFALDFISILAQAQKISAISNLTQFLSIIGNEVAVDQGILDNVNLDKATRHLAEMADIPSDIIRSEGEVAKIRGDKARNAQMQVAAENAQKLAGAAQAMGQTPLGGDTLLAKVMPMIAGGAAQPA